MDDQTTQFQRQFRDNALSLAAKARSKEVREYRKEQRAQGRSVNSLQAKNELRERREIQTQANNSVLQALQNALPNFAKDPAGFLGAPKKIDLPPPFVPAPLADPVPFALSNTNPISSPNTVTYNAGSETVTTETKAEILRPGQTTIARRLRADASSFIEVEVSGDDSYIDIRIKAPPSSGEFFISAKDGVIAWEAIGTCPGTPPPEV